MNDPDRPSRLPAIIFVLALSAAAVAAAWYFRPMPVETPPALLASSPGIEVRDEALGIAYLPSAVSGEGLIFYPGARVPPEAYAWLGAGLASKGHPVIIVRFPLNFAIFAPGRASEVIAAHHEAARWAIGGHSLGGVMAAAWAHGHRSEAAGLVLLAAWPPDSADFSSSSLPVLLVSASEDGLATEGKILAASRLLPPTSRRVVIQGGNHAQFGEYGAQPGDGRATIDGDRQRAMALDAIVSFLEGGGS